MIKSDQFLVLIIFAILCNSINIISFPITNILIEPSSSHDCENIIKILLLRSIWFDFLFKSREIRYQLFYFYILPQQKITPLVIPGHYIYFINNTYIRCFNGFPHHRPIFSIPAFIIFCEYFIRDSANISSNSLEIQPFKFRFIIFFKIGYPASLCILYFQIFRLPRITFLSPNSL